ncbi:MAG: exodeoxyribonuclease VII large subunit [Clostridia bacterium]|nr:exodeoxyribonuclease VII large subunit [Clostridia bacterium]
MQNLTLTITQLNTYIKQIIDSEELISNVSVHGEISNFKVSNGNAYFDIKEEGAQLSCIRFGESSSQFKNGDQVLVTGRLNYHIKLGRLTFVANKIEAYGMGELYKKYLELKEKLEEQGIFDERYKKQIPKYAMSVGVVTSETGAVIRDILHVRAKKNPYTTVYIYPSKVQGVNAEDDVVRGIKFFSEEFPVDVIIVARGGGSFEDLAPFNTEKVARAAFECKIPIISAVGHETDFSLLDFAADFRAPTPSVAGEVAFFDFENEVGRIKGNIESAKYFMDKKLKYEKTQVELKVANNLGIVENMFLEDKSKISRMLMSLETAIDKLVAIKTHELEKMIFKLEENNPLTILKKGYAKITRDEDVISSIKNVKLGDEITVQLRDGKFVAEVNDIQGEQK